MEEPMARKKAAEQPQEPDVFDEQIALRQAEAVQQAAAAALPPEGHGGPTSPEGQTAEERPARNPVRPWTERYAEPLRYRKFSDDVLKVIGFQIILPDGQKTPPQEVLDLLHSMQRDGDGRPTGLRFETTRRHGKVWTVPNDPEGRALADRLDFELNKLAHKMEQELAAGR
jgi:hypothetical protein